MNLSDGKCSSTLGQNFISFLKTFIWNNSNQQKGENKDTFFCMISDQMAFKIAQI
jgi:hypothetical protein